MIWEEILNFEPYRAVEGNYRIWLDKNESPYDLPPQLKEEILEELKRIEFNRYPHITSDPLREALAEFYGLKKENIAVGNGSDELINYLVKMFKGKYIVVTSPTFGMYSFFAKLHGIPVKDIPLKEDFTIDGERIAEEGKAASAIFIASPNNPTGNSQPENEVLKVLDSGRVVILDEAYSEFSGKSFIPKISEYENLVILRTFSKAFGLAGIRCGYMIANEKIIDALYRILPPYNLNSLTMTVAIKMLEHYDIVKRRIKLIVKERERIRREFIEYSYPSEANFLLMKLDAYDYLLKKGIVVRKLSGRLEGHIRVTIGKKWENDELIKALKEFLEECRCG
ncbi:histidinol-phosphate transaminase [Pyrococcus furiosus DSM 3638]|uniref:Histidinol-phosphate aminotransferase n=3 Tax=Pyrococcus furiosus TaxID=2261 RepID=HIS8_PYRFU|nr:MULTISPECIES: histidinol-phosphate transaminase [Pyrococcus]Q8TH25.1 RecName: Full=Histidinol-phosphate aminotransferase; AltName: Full=Imidazole acetol-phosphate transaminase [Pyrococcus furiosus DSM 3638]AAL81789.1 putative histidinol-phosphate aminotransferase (imidazole [Pyrococcus furiosus DSM 3638]AFN04975.1 histidinol-phosphate aminotransferase [Pyrococcus furiosus COM1]MDK2869483.1 histidinol-phosphate aminotransferase [Pyrococcus sp.]QEK79286.1 histidinol-phosphate transaminase [Py